jgi:hypothetical protein
MLLKLFGRISVIVAMILLPTQLPDVLMDLLVEIEFAKELSSLVTTVLELASLVDHPVSTDLCVTLMSVFQPFPNYLEKDVTVVWLV